LNVFIVVRDLLFKTSLLFLLHLNFHEGSPFSLFILVNLIDVGNLVRDLVTLHLFLRKFTHFTLNETVSPPLALDSFDYGGWVDSKVQER